MLKLLRREKKENCTGQDIVFRYYFTRPLEMDDWQKFSSLGNLIIYHSFPVPYCRCQGAGFLLKGVCGKDYLDSVVLSDRQAGDLDRLLINALEARSCN